MSPPMGFGVDWEQAKDAFQVMLDVPLNERPSKLEEMEKGDSALASQVRWLLDEYARAEGFLEVTEIDHSPVFSPMQRVGGRFVVGRLVGRGGMGEVYEAYDEVLAETIALKTIRRSLLHQPDARRRFLAEVQHARKITHTNICRIFDVFEDSLDSGVPFFSMEYLDGITLAQAQAKAADLPGRSIALQVAQGLQAAHAQGILHRDLKPSNILLLDTGDGMRAVVTDFGLAAHEVPAMRDEVLAGTPKYMAPELLAGAAPSVASDIYALGRLYECLLPEHPITAKCLIPDPAKRPRTAGEVIEALHPPRLLERRSLIVIGLALGGAGAVGLWRTNIKPSWTGRRRLFVEITGPRKDTLPHALLSAALHQSPRLSVVPESEVQQLLRRLRGNATDARTLARELQAPLILTSRLDYDSGQWRWRLILRDTEFGKVLGKTTQYPGAAPVWAQAADRTALAVREIAGESGEELKSSYVPLDRTTSASPRAVEAYYSGLRRIEAGEVNEALVLFEDAISADPTFAMAHHEKARALSILAREVSALEASETAFGLRGRVTVYERLWIEGMSFALRADSTRALETFRNLTTRYSDDARVWRQFAQLCGLCLRTGEAVQAARKVVELDSFSAIARVQLGLFLCENGHDDEALVLVREARREGINHSSLDWAEGQAFVDLGKYPEARTSFERMRQGSTFDRQARMRSCALSILEGKIVEAADTLQADLAYDASAEEQQRQFRARHWLALLHGIMGQPEKALVQIRRLLQLPVNPACLEAYRNAALSACFVHHTQEARRALDGLRKIELRWPSRHTTAIAAHVRGQIAATEKDFKTARTSLLEAVGLWPDPLIRLSLGWLYQSRGQHDEAVELFGEAETQRGSLLRRENPVYFPLLLLAHARSESALARFDLSVRLYEQVLSMWSIARESVPLAARAVMEHSALLAKRK